MTRFRALHADGIFVMPNPWDVGSAKLLASLGFEALATTSAGLAWSLGKLDMQVTREELVAHVARISAATTLPLNVDSERCFPDEPGGVGETVRLLADAGAAGCSIEDFDPATGAIEALEVAAERVAIAAAAAPLVLTARAENHLHGVDDLDDTIARLQAYRDAGADVVCAPGLTDREAIARVVDEVGVVPVSTRRPRRRRRPEPRPTRLLAGQSGATLPVGALAKGSPEYGRADRRRAGAARCRNVRLRERGVRRSA